MAEKDNRSAQVHLRLTADEAARMRERAGASGLGLSAYIRRAALSGGEPAPVADARELRPLYAELRRCGSNVNQIARALNAHGPRGAPPGLMGAALAELERAARAVAEELTRARG